MVARKKTSKKKSRGNPRSPRETTAAKPRQCNAADACDTAIEILCMAMDVMIAAEQTASAADNYGLSQLDRKLQSVDLMVAAALSGDFALALQEKVKNLKQLVRSDRIRLALQTANGNR